MFGPCMKHQISSKYVPPKLSYHMDAALYFVSFDSRNKVWIYIIFTVALSIALYSASVLDLDIVGYFLAH
jgi:hypothetical protein